MPRSVGEGRTGVRAAGLAGSGHGMRVGRPESWAHRPGDGAARAEARRQIPASGPRALRCPGCLNTAELGPPDQGVSRRCSSLVSRGRGPLSARLGSRTHFQAHPRVYGRALGESPPRPPGGHLHKLPGCAQDMAADRERETEADRQPDRAGTVGRREPRSFRSLILEVPPQGSLLPSAGPPTLHGGCTRREQRRGTSGSPLESVPRRGEDAPRESSVPWTACASAGFGALGPSLGYNGK